MAFFSVKDLELSDVLASTKYLIESSSVSSDSGRISLYLQILIIVLCSMQAPTGVLKFEFPLSFLRPALSFRKQGMHS